MANELAGRRRMLNFPRVAKFRGGKWNKIVKDAGIRAE